MTRTASLYPSGYRGLSRSRWHALKVVADSSCLPRFSVHGHSAFTSSCHAQWPSIKPRRITAPTNGQQGGTVEPGRSLGPPRPAAQVRSRQANRQQRSLMYFFTSGNAFQMLFHGDCFHIQMHFSQILSGLCLNSNVFFHFRKCIPNAPSWRLLPF